MDARELPTPEDGSRAALAELEEALTLAAAAPGRRKLEQLEELLLLRVAEPSRD